ncbi:ribonucleoside triphosphate reductase [Candidatus Berkelbacteria bacterium RIFCSPHIGHO2_12_FULL_36_9]|uniref:Ribonucleoside triphosphate reductase n=1 Tax=Candidatus Berkelbacteria bacterium RIFCSPHIGHO2_12_FULL_36_9 TaxID=1797469 RepID=A0A1F5EKR1_9BACT|nr:MAG: ribonucleoside triphosphate reductase [Candidatus Berkelbacteria bacterium RIFCSPHIGHO2_12_FULL_36_9]
MSSETQKNVLSKIRKRDGRIVDFDLEKITQAIFKAGRSTGEYNYRKAKELTRKVTKTLNKEFDGHTIPEVEEIQDRVEKILIESEYHDTAKSYIIYREQHAKMRDLQTLMDSDKLMEEYLDRLDWRVKENANMSYSLQGLNNYVASSVSAHYWLNKAYPKVIQNAHTSGDFHIHDLQLLSAYCAGWDLKDMLIQGFRGAPNKIESAPPKHFRSALGQAVNFFYTLQGEIAGAQAFANFDTYLAPFIHYDKLTYKEVKQSIQEFLFNMNVPTRVGFQTPFTNITLDLKPTKMVGNENVIIGGKPQNKKYKDFQKEMDMFNIAFCEIMTEGDASGRVFTFPIPTYNITRDFDWNSPVSKKVFTMSAKYGIPYFSNFINSDMDPDDARSMCCRLRLDNRELRKRGGGLFGANPLTGSIGVVTFNMPRLGYIAKNKKDYYKKLTDLMDLAKESLEMKRKILERLTKQGLYPYSKYYLAGIKRGFGGYWQNHFSTIGINGMNESLLNFTGNDLTTKEGQEFTKEILDFMRNRLMDYQNETNHLYNLEATPAEGTSYRLARLDKKKYSDIIVANEENFQKNNTPPYYTNSTNMPVYFSDDIFEALDIQDDIQTRYTGGTVLHGFLGEKIEDVQVCMKLVKKIAENYHLPYFTITPTFSVCPKHGYLAGEHFFCHKCDKEIGYVENKKDLEKLPERAYN